MNKLKLLIPLILTCVIAGQVGIGYSDDYISHLQVSAENIYLSAGRRSNITLTLTNTGNFDITEVDIMLTSTTPGLSVISSGQRVFNKIPSESSISFNATLYIDQGLTYGAYPLTLSGSYVRLGKSITLSVPVTVIVNNIFQPMIKMSVSPSTINAGQVNNVTVTIQNIALEDLENLDLTLSSASPMLSIEGQINYDLPTLRAGATVAFGVKVKALDSTPIGPYTLSSLIYYTDSANNPLKQNSAVSLEVTNPLIVVSPILTVANVSSITVVPGQQFRVGVNVLCSGSSVYNVKTTLTLDPRGLLSPLSPTSASLGDMKPGDIRELQFDLLLDGSAPAGTLPMTLTMKYVDSKAVQGSSSEVITIPVDEIASFGLLEDTVVSAEVGKTSTLEADLILTGTSRLEFVRIEAIPVGPIKQVEGSRQYIGAVDTDSPVPFTLKYSVSNGTAEGSYTLRMKVTWVDHRNLPREQILDLPLSVVRPAPVVNKPVDEGFWGWLKRILGIQ